MLVKGATGVLDSGLLAIRVLKSFYISATCNLLANQLKIMAILNADT